MRKEDIAAKLNEIKQLAEEALQTLGLPTGPKRKEKPRIRAARTPRRTLPNQILLLKEEGFFRQPRTAAEVHKKLQSIYSCDLNRVAVALHRLHKKKALRRTSKGTGKDKQVAYVW